MRLEYTGEITHPGLWEAQNEIVEAFKGKRTDKKHPMFSFPDGTPEVIVSFLNAIMKKRSSEVTFDILFWLLNDFDVNTTSNQIVLELSKCVENKTGWKIYG